jgi:hypothetical protein
MNVKGVGVFCLLLSVAWATFADELKINGIYNGINLHIQNPHDGSNNYCISAIYLNNLQIKTPNTTLITIDLGSLKVGDKVEVKIVYKDKCTPKVLNPNALLPRGDFHFGKLKVDVDALYWEGRGENENGQYYVEIFKNGAWQAEKIIPAQGSKGINNYTLKINHLSGLNRYKIKYIDSSGKSYFSDELEFASDKSKVYFYPKNVSTTIYFSKVVKYEVLDANHKPILKGSGSEVDCTSLSSGNYFVLFENRTESFYKKPN